MTKNKHKNSYTLFALHIPVLILAGLFIYGATYFVENYQPGDSNQIGAVLGRGNDQGRGNSQSSKADKADRSNNNDRGRPENPGNQGNSANKPTDLDGINRGPSPQSRGNSKSQGSANAVLHKQNVDKVVGQLKKVAEEEEAVGNEEVSNVLEEVANEEEEGADEVAEAIEEVETRPRWKTLLLGSDYKNLGQLRSHLAHNTNSIRKLTRVQNLVQNEGNDLAVQEQMQTLLQERERITGVIAEHEDDFGILGWASRLLSGYLGGSIDNIDDYLEVSETTESTESVPSSTEPSTEEPGTTEPAL